MILTGIIAAILGLWIISQSMQGSRLGPSLTTIGLTLVLVGLWK